MTKETKKQIIARYEEKLKAASDRTEYAEARRNDREKTVNELREEISRLKETLEWSKAADNNYWKGKYEGMIEMSEQLLMTDEERKLKLEQIIKNNNNPRF